MSFNKEKILSLIAIVVVHNLTKDKISINKEQAALTVINEVIPVKYDNDLFQDKITIDVPAYINHTKTITVYRARLNNEPVAISLMPIISKGYNGNISLVIGIAYNGDLMEVRIINHNETEGFGDQAHQDNSKWLFGFNGYSLETAEEKWAIKKDGGEFDQLSGATITSRSIINIIYKTLKYYSKNRDKFYL